MLRSSWLATHLAALRALLVLTVLVGLAYPLVVLGISQLPGLKERAAGSLVYVAGSSKPVGSRLIGQSFTDSKGNALVQYFQSRPSEAGDGYDPTSSGASNLGPEDVVDTLPDPKSAAGSEAAEGTQSLLTQVCARSFAIGESDRVDGSRPFCTADGVGAVLSVFRRDGLTGPVTRAVSLNQACPAQPFISTWGGVRVVCATPGTDYSGGVTTPIRGQAPADPAVPADAVTASGSGLDPNISPAYASIQTARVAEARGIPAAEVAAAVGDNTSGRLLGFLGQPRVDVLALNLDLNRRYPYRG